MNALFYLIKIGCQWRMLPDNFVPWNMVYFYFRKCKNEGLMRGLYDALRSYVRRKTGKDGSSSLGIIDSCSVKIVYF